jgi:hypothetical protein
MVGGGTLLPGNIDAMTCMTDTVYVAVRDIEGPGSIIFYSQALFDESGSIICWMPWQIALRTTNPILEMNSDAERGEFILLEKTKDGLKIKETELKENKEIPPFLKKLYALVKEEFPLEHGGVHKIVFFDEHTKGLSGNHQSAMLAIMGDRKVVLAQLAAGTHSEQCKEHTDAKGIAICENGTLSLTSTQQADILVIRGGVLNELGIINNAAIVSDNMYSWLVLSSDTGVAVLANEYGQGWSSIEGIKKHFAEFPTLAFRKLGQWSHIRKLSSLDNTLFVLTRSTLDRVLLSTEMLQKYTQERIVDARHFASAISFTDLYSSRALLVLGTTKGLWYALHSDDPAYDGWHEIPLIKGDTFIKTITPFYNENLDMGNIYITAQSRTHDKTRVHRISLNKGTIGIVPDSLFKDTMTGLTTYSHRRDNATSDGMAVISTCSTGKYAANIVAEPIGFSTSIRSLRGTQQNSKAINLNQKGWHTINGIVRDPYSGIWILGGNFGLMFIAIHE